MAGSAFHVVICCFGWSRWKKNLASHRYVLENRVAISACGYLLILEQNSSGNFLEINFNVESATLSVNFLHSDTLKSISLPFSLNGSLTHAWFCNIVHWNTGSLSYPDLPNIDISLFIPQNKIKNHINITDVIGKDIKWIWCFYWE